MGDEREPAVRCGDGGGRPGRQIWKQATVQCPGREQNPRHGGGGSGAGGLRPVARSPGSQKGPSELRHLPVGLSSLTVVWLRGRGWGGASGQGSGRSLRVHWGHWSLASLRQPDPERAAGGARETASEGESVWGRCTAASPGVQAGAWQLPESWQRTLTALARLADSCCCCWMGSCQH